ncbi:hypothetical protein K3495_g17248, partial [Podosphaera aphanis]
MLLSDVLYVPNLGINLLSVRRLCQAGLKFTGDKDTLLLLDGKRKVVTAKMHNGLYVVSHISKGYEETAFPSMEIDSATSYQMEHATHHTEDKGSAPSDDSQNITCDQNYGILNDTDDTDIQDLNDETDKARDVERYLLWHRRFAHLGPDKIRNLHNVTTLKKQIKIPRNLD